MREIKLIAKMTPLNTFFTIVCYLLIIICIALNLIFSNAATFHSINSSEQTIFFFSIDFLTLIVIFSTLYISFYSMNLVDFFRKSNATPFFFSLPWRYKQLIKAHIILITLMNIILIGLCYVYFLIIDKPLLIMTVFVCIAIAYVFSTIILNLTYSGQYDFANILGVVFGIILFFVLMFHYNSINNDYEMNLNLNNIPFFNIFLYHFPYIFLIFSICLFIFSYPMYYKKLVSSSKC
ncbi:hypothetical protein BVH56_06935 [Abyssicoccus albus]|nr:hypothetical protein BVH56_06935 [Abyssicoccus albus]